MFDVQKMIDAAKKLGIDVRLNSSNPGLYVDNGTTKTKYTSKELLLIDDLEEYSYEDEGQDPDEKE